MHPALTYEVTHNAQKILCLTCEERDRTDANDGLQDFDLVELVRPVLLALPEELVDFFAGRPDVLLVAYATPDWPLGQIPLFQAPASADGIG